MINRRRLLLAAPFLGELFDVSDWPMAPTPAPTVQPTPTPSANWTKSLGATLEEAISFYGMYTNRSGNIHNWRKKGGGMHIWTEFAYPRLVSGFELTTKKKYYLGQSHLTWVRNMLPKDRELLEVVENDFGFSEYYRSENLGKAFQIIAPDSKTPTKWLDHFDTIYEDAQDGLFTFHVTFFEKEDDTKIQHLGAFIPKKYPN